MTPHPFDAVLFDLDGTLVDSAPDLGAAADKLRTDRGLAPLPLDAYRALAGAGARALVPLAVGVQPEEAAFAQLREEFFSNYEACLTQRTRAFEGVEQLIGELTRHGIRWGVVTNKPMRFAGPLTRAMRLFDTAETVVGGDSTPHAKPHPEPLLEAARQLGVDPSRCLYVGDDERDIVAGRRAGMTTVAARYGYLGDAQEVQRWGADFQVAEPLRVLALALSVDLAATA